VATAVTGYWIRCAGATNREIADALVIALPTAERHVANVRGKLGLRSRARVGIWAAQNGLIP
jgi:DNA-binding NarL/FixJ family response regulator